MNLILKNAFFFKKKVNLKYIVNNKYLVNQSFSVLSTNHTKSL